MIEAILICLIMGADLEFARRAPESYYCSTGVHRYECVAEAFFEDVFDASEQLGLIDNEDWQ